VGINYVLIGGSGEMWNDGLAVCPCNFRIARVETKFVGDEIKKDSTYIQRKKQAETSQI